MSSSVCASSGRTAADAVAPPWLEWAVAERARPGEAVSGDAAHVALRGGTAVVAAVDGLGHGPAAADASRRAVDALRTAADADPDALVVRCHDALRGTRGAALGVAVVGGDTLAWAGVGNVEGWVFAGAGAGRARPTALLRRPGVVGGSLPTPQPVRERLRRGDVLVLVSDGISGRFADDLDPVGSPQAIADAILHTSARATDDALVVVARYLGVRP